MRRLLPVLLLCGCATMTPPTRTPLTAAERRSLDGEGALPVVTNTTPEGDAALRRRSLPIAPSDPELPRLVARLLATVRAEQGVGVAAPQVGLSRRVILVERRDREGHPFVAYLNPSITRSSPDKLLDWEGCLSIPAGHGMVERARAITVAHDTLDRGRLTEEVEGFVARIFQHEIDHLDGVLFIDRKVPGPLLTKDEYRAMRARER